MAFNFFGKKKRQTEELTPLERFMQDWAALTAQELIISPSQSFKKNTEGFFTFFYEQQTLITVLYTEGRGPHHQKLVTTLFSLWQQRGREVSYFTEPTERIDEKGFFRQAVSPLAGYHLNEGGYLWLNTSVVNETAPSPLVNEFPHLFIFNALWLALRVKKMLNAFTFSVQKWQKVYFTEKISAYRVDLTIKGENYPYFIDMELPENEQDFWKRVLAHQLKETIALYKKIDPSIEVNYSRQLVATQDYLVGSGSVRFRYNKSVAVRVLIQPSALEAVSRYLVSDEPSSRSDQALALVNAMNFMLSQRCYKQLNRFFLYGSAVAVSEKNGTFQQQMPPMVADFLSVVSEQDFKILVQNYLTTRIDATQLWQLLRFNHVQKTAEGEKTVVMSLSDFDGAKLMSFLPSQSKEAQKKAPVLNFNEWSALNTEILTQIALAVRKKELDVSFACQQCFRFEILEPLERQQAEFFEKEWKEKFIKYWSLCQKKEKEKFVARLDNRQWAEILAIKTDNFDTISKYISSGRRVALKEELDYIEQRGLNYSNAMTSLKALLP